MLTICSFLQSVWQIIRALTARFVGVTKRMYRSSAVLMAGTAVVAVMAFACAGFSGGGRNALTAYANTPPEDGEEAEDTEEETEEIAVLTEAKIQVHLTNSESLKSGQLLVGSRLAERVREEESARQERKAAAEETKEEIRRIAEEEAERERIRQAEEAEKERIRQEKEARRAAAVVSYSDQDYEVLTRIVQAEAGGCDMKGKILVANVVINRVRSGKFPGDITNVVYQKSQFSPVLDGSINRCQVTDDTVEAVNRALAGEDYSGGALYFMNRGISGSGNVRWFDGNLTYLFEHGGHEFFK